MGAPLHKNLTHRNQTMNGGLSPQSRHPEIHILRRVLQHSEKMDYIMVHVDPISPLAYAKHLYRRRLPVCTVGGAPLRNQWVRLQLLGPTTFRTMESWHEDSSERVTTHWRGSPLTMN